jgi:hypothetical protein
VAENVSPDVLAYMKSRDATPKILVKADCTFSKWYGGKWWELRKRRKEDIGDYVSLTTCVAPYTDIKSRWVKYPLARDWLEDCETCTGPVLIADVRDVYFQADPFGPGSPKVEGLQVFEEHKNLTTEHWLVSWPAQACKNSSIYNKTMLCSGTTIGTRQAMMQYLAAMYEEMKIWISTEECRLWTIADDQSIHNWLFFAGKFSDAVAIHLREGIVNTIGFEADKRYRAHINKWLARNVSANEARGDKAMDGATNKSWIGMHHGWTNEDGFFVNKDGSISRVIHQFDRVNVPSFDRWLLDFIKE